jgi:hypothetical protein
MHSRQRTEILSNNDVTVENTLLLEQKILKIGIHKVQKKV